MLLVSSFCLAFLWSVWKKDITVDAAAFIGLATAAVNFWFTVARPTNSRATDAAPEPPANGAIAATPGEKT